MSPENGLGVALDEMGGKQPKGHDSDPDKEEKRLKSQNIRDAARQRKMDGGLTCLSLLF